MATQPVQRITFDEFFELERKADSRSEFHAGEIYAMSGGTEPHSRPVARMVALFSQPLENCRVYDCNLMLRIERFDKGVYPDCMLVCGEPVFWGKHKDVVLNPTLVVEILSSSTEAYDKSDKSMDYRSVPSLQHCLLISQDSVFIKHSSRREDGGWNITQISDRGTNFALSGFGAEIAADTIYRSIL